MDGHAISFGPYRLVATRRLLLEGDKPVRLGSRAFDILTAFVERAGEVVGKEELIARTWPTTFVEEAGSVQKLVGSRGNCDSCIWTADEFEPLTERAGSTCPVVRPPMPNVATEPLPVWWMLSSAQ
jgi:hypothetical protein